MTASKPAVKLTVFGADDLDFFGGRLACASLWNSVLFQVEKLHPISWACARSEDAKNVERILRASFMAFSFALSTVMRTALITSVPCNFGLSVTFGCSWAPSAATFLRCWAM